MSEQVWISHKDAMALVNNSAWARNREPSFSIIDQIQSGTLRQGMAANEKKSVRFHRLCEMMLEQFVEYRKGGTKIAENGERLYSEGDLRKHLERAFDKDVIDEFGELPSPN